jgi:iron complex outermembrane receptor protein
MYRYILLASASLMAAPALAEETTADIGESDAEIIVTGAFQRDLRDSSSPVSVVAEAELQRDLRPQLGDALATQAGVSATSFGPNASRPVLRGLQGERVRILTDGIGAFDVSNTSADHAVAIDPLLADRIEVLRGPASMRFGSSAIGGVVNVLDKRIPISVPDDGALFELTGSYGSAARERAAGGAVTAAIGDSFAVRAGGAYTKTGDLRTGAFILSRDLRTEAAASIDPDIRALSKLRGRLPNSSGETKNASVGVAHINDGGNIGIALTRYETTYGLPIRFDLSPGAEQEAVSIDAKQTRADIRAGLNIPSGFFESLNLRGGYADYAHVEKEADGAVGTLFANEGYEARAELRQRKRGGWQGVSGVQTFLRDFLAVGAEAFVPPNETDQTGIFTLQEIEAGAFRFEFGGRIEKTSIRSQDVGFDRSFTARSVAAGVFADLGGGFKLGLNLSTTARAPAAEELLANGPHVGTQSYEIGDPSFGIERARGIELIARAGGDGWSIDAAAYITRFKGYIYEFETGAIIDDLPVFQFAQGDARYEGIEVEAQAQLFELGETQISADLVADAVRANIDHFGPAPRIPPYRLLAGLNASGTNWNARVDVERTGWQKRVTGFETETPSSTRVNLSSDWKPFAGKNVRLSLSANNLFDVDARRHASFLKDYAPLAGRDFRISIRTAL